MKRKLVITIVLALALAALPLGTALAYDIEFTVNGMVWKLTVPDCFVTTPGCAATAAPKPTATAKPTQTPQPTQAPQPTATAQPTQAPQPTATAQPAQTPDRTAGTAAANEWEGQMLTWVNRERTSKGLGALKLDARLTYWARAKSQDMADLRYFAHNSPTYGSSAQMLRDGGVSYTACAENIARYGSLYKAHVGLMSSPGHYANIMNRSMTGVGIGVVRLPSGVFYITELFIR